jgi:superfamily I DNA/RNA helicase
LESYYTKGQCRLLYAWVLVLAGLASPTQLLWLFTGEEQLGRHVPETVFAALQPTFREHDSAQATRLVLQGLAGTGSISLLTLYERLLEGTGQLPISALLHLVIEYYQLDMKEGDICRFRQLALGFEQSVPALAKHLLHFSDSVLYDNRAEAVTLSTLHAAKGLEFPIVFIAGVEEDLVPLAPRQSLSLEQVQAHLQEERRLFFVGITRAISMLYLSWCRKRSLYGGPAQPRQRSSFIKELPAELLTPPPPVRPTTIRRTTYRQLSLFP